LPRPIRGLSSAATDRAVGPATDGIGQRVELVPVAERCERAGEAVRVCVLRVLRAGAGLRVLRGCAPLRAVSWSKTRLTAWPTLCSAWETAWRRPGEIAYARTVAAMPTVALATARRVRHEPPRAAGPAGAGWRLKRA